MNPAPCSWRGVTWRSDDPASPRYSSTVWTPGMPNTRSTPYCSSSLTSASPQVCILTGRGWLRPRAWPKSEVVSGEFMRFLRIDRLPLHACLRSGCVRPFLLRDSRTANDAFACSPCSRLMAPVKSVIPSDESGIDIRCIYGAVRTRSSPSRHDFRQCGRGSTIRRQPPLNALQTFEMVARHRSFARAADHLCLTQGAVSRQIQALEDYYGFPLLTRQPKGLALTIEGEQLLPSVQESFARIEEVSLRLTRQRSD